MSQLYFNGHEKSSSFLLVCAVQWNGTQLNSIKNAAKIVGYDLLSVWFRALQLECWLHEIRKKYNQSLHAMHFWIIKWVFFRHCCCCCFDYSWCKIKLTEQKKNEIFFSSFSSFDSFEISTFKHCFVRVYDILRKQFRAYSVRTSAVLSDPCNTVSLLFHVDISIHFVAWSYSCIQMDYSNVCVAQHLFRALVRLMWLNKKWATHTICSFTFKCSTISNALRHLLDQNQCAERSLGRK